MIIMKAKQSPQPSAALGVIWVLCMVLLSTVEGRSLFNQPAQLLLTAIVNSNTTILAAATYTFSFSRFSATPIPLNSYLLLTFTGQYAAYLPASPTCTASGLGSNSPPCSFTSSALYVSQLFTTASSLTANSFTLSVSNITNPSPAGTYTPLSTVAIIAPNASVFQSGSAATSVATIGGNAVCVSSLSNAYVFQRGQVTVTYQSSYITAATSSKYDLYVSIPSTYPDDLTNQDIKSNMTGTLSVYPGLSLFQTTFTSSFTITMLMPPSTRPQSNFISIYTQTNTGTIGAIDSCSITIANIQPNTFTSISISQGVVQTTATLAFDLTLSTPLFQSDTLTISFPQVFGLTAVATTVSVAGYGVLTLTRFDNNILISSISSQPVSNARLIFSISGIAMPFTTVASTLSIFLGTSGNYSRIVQSYSYSAAPGPLNISVTCLNNEIGTANTRCLFSFTTVSQIAANGTLNILFPNAFTLPSGPSPCSISGNGLKSNINCLYTPTTNTIQASSLTASTTNIMPMAITLNVTVSMPQSVGTYSLNVYTQSSGGTVDQGSVALSATSRALKVGEFAATSSSTVTNSPTVYTLTFSLPFDLGVTYTVSVFLPFAVQTGLSVSVSGGTLLSFSSPTLTFTSNQLTSNASITISNLLTPSSLQPTAITVQVIYQSVAYFTGSATITMSQLKQFSFVGLLQSNQIVSAAAIATITLGGLNTGDKVVLAAGYGGFYANSQPNCSSTVVTCGVSGVLAVLAADSASTTTFSINMQNLGYVGQSQLNITSYDNSQNYAKLSSVITLTVTTPNVISVTANQTNPYLNEATTYTFSLQMATPSATILLITPPSGLLVTATACLLNCGNATKLTVGYIFPVTSTTCIVTFSLTNPMAYGSSIKFVFKTSNSFGDMDYGEYIPQDVCNSPCRSCSPSAKSVCLTCYSWSAQTILYNSTCITACPIGFYQALSSGVSICSPCQSLCTVCSFSSSNCSSCQNGMYIYNSGCYQTCPLGTYINPSNICIACLQVNCSVCNDTTCTSCFTGSSFLNGSCLATCIANYYSYNGNCVPCAATCLVCSPTTGSCSSCLSPYLLYGGSCYNSCPVGVYQQLNNNLCEACQSPCASCSIFSTNCTSCLHIFNSSSYFYLTNICYQNQCPNGYYGDTSSNLCVQCPSGCPTCTSSACLTCASSLFLYQGRCYSQCPTGTYQNSTICIVCSSICGSCLSASVCTSCISGYNLYNSACLTSCPAYYYANLTGNICLPCSTPCGLCSYLGCINCLSGYYLQQTTCTASCTGPYHPNNSTMLCESCQVPCSGCTWSSTCTSCLSGYSLMGSSCLSGCPIGYYSNGALCISCPNNCTTCTFINNQPACTACSASLNLYSFSCVGSCPSNTKQSGGYCFSPDCSNLPHCVSCAGTECVQCSSLYLMDSSFACSQYVSSSSIANALMGIPVPFPFLIAILMIIIISFLLKHNFPKMFSPLFIYAIAGCFQFLCLVLWTLLSVFWNMGAQQPLPYESVVYAPVIIGGVYIFFNVLQFILWNKRIAADRQYKLWEKQDNRCASLSIAIVSLVFSFRLDTLKFSRTAHNPHLSARLTSPEMFRHYSVLAILSLMLSAVTILVSVYISYLQTSLNYLFFTGIEIAVIAIIMILLSVAVLCVSKAQLLEDRSEYQVGYDQDQIEGKSVEELLNGLGIVEEHHEHHQYEDSGNAVLMKNDYSSEQYSQDLTLMEPAQLMAFDDKIDSQLELNSQGRKKTEEPEGPIVEEEDNIFAKTAEVSSDSHILVDQFENDRKEAQELARHYGLAEQPLNTTYPRQTGAILKQRLPSLHEDPSEIESVGSFEQFTVDITKGKWRKQTPTRLANETVEPQGEFIEEFQIKQLIEQKIKQEEAERRQEQQERQLFQAEQRRKEELRKRVEELKLQEIAKEQERVKQLQRQQQLARQNKIQEQKRKQEEELRKKQQEQRQIKRKQEQESERLKKQEQDKQRKILEEAAIKEQKRIAEQEKKQRESKEAEEKAKRQEEERRSKAEERLQKIQAQKKREEQWRIKKEQARLQKLEEERILQEKMERLRREEEELREQMRQEEAKELARIEEQRRKKLEESRRELEKINKLKASLQALEGMAQEFQVKDKQLEQEQSQLQFHKEEKRREARERTLMSVEDRLSRMTIVFEDMWRKAAQISHRSRRIRNEEEKQSKFPKQPINYHNPDDQNLISELSPRKIKVSPRPLPEQYTRKHLFVEQGREILQSCSQEEELCEQEELEIIFEGGQGRKVEQGKMIEEKAVEKPKSILQRHRPVRTKIDYLHYHDHDKKEIEEMKIKETFANAAKKAPAHKEMPKEDTEDPIPMVFQNKMAEVLQMEEEEEKHSEIWSHPSALLQQPSKEPPSQQKIAEDPIDIEYIGRSIHSGSSDTHWPIEPEMHERILEIERRADRYISQPKHKDPLQPRYVELTPEDQIYEEEGEEETQLGEIVFQESDQILENDSRATGKTRSMGSSSGRRRYPTGRVNRRIIDLSPEK